MSDNVGLGDVERLIDTQVLVSNDAISRDAKFKETVLAIFSIIEGKLYREKNLNIEQYFRIHWDISRAQAYRLYNCGLVVKELEEFPIQPNRERYCRVIKRITSSIEERKILWSKILENISGNQSLLSTSLIVNVWNRMMTELNQKTRMALPSGDPLPPNATIDLDGKIRLIDKVEPGRSSVFSEREALDQNETRDSISSSRTERLESPEKHYQTTNRPKNIRIATHPHPYSLQSPTRRNSDHNYRLNQASLGHTDPSNFRLSSPNDQTSNIDTLTEAIDFLSSLQNEARINHTPTESQNFKPVSKQVLFDQASMYPSPQSASVSSADTLVESTYSSSPEIVKSSNTHSTSNIHFLLN